jgi:hypothetical protein
MRAGLFWKKLHTRSSARLASSCVGDPTELTGDVFSDLGRGVVGGCIDMSIRARGSTVKLGKVCGEVGLIIDSDIDKPILAFFAFAFAGFFWRRTLETVLKQNEI